MTVMKILVQPQLPLGRVVLAIMDEPVMQAFVILDTVEAIDAALEQLAAARVAVFGDPDAIDQEAALNRHWSCGVGDDCRCGKQLTASPPIIPQCTHFRGWNSL